MPAILGRDRQKASVDSQQKLLNQQREALQKALSQAVDYTRLHPKAPTGDTIWASIASSAQRYQKALDQLQTDWQPTATPTRLSDDFFAVTHGYDELLTSYNREAMRRY